MSLAHQNGALCAPSWMPSDSGSPLRAALNPQRAGGERSQFVPYLAARRQIDELLEASPPARAETAQLWQAEHGRLRWLVGLARVQDPGIAAELPADRRGYEDRQRMLEALRMAFEVPVAQSEADWPASEEPIWLEGDDWILRPAHPQASASLQGCLAQVQLGIDVWIGARRLREGLRDRDGGRVEDWCPLAIAAPGQAEASLPAGLLIWSMAQGGPR